MTLFSINLSMRIYGCLNIGYESVPVEVEAEFRQGLPMIQIVGYAGTAVKESSDRVRLALSNSGFVCPMKKIYVNLYPGSIRKESAFLDLAIALKIMEKAGLIPSLPLTVSAMGELKLSGEVCRCDGIIAGIGAGAAIASDIFIVSSDNRNEASLPGKKGVYAVSSLKEAAEVITMLDSGEHPPQAVAEKAIVQEDSSECGDFSEILGEPLLKEALVYAALGSHHLMLTGPPGCGKTMAAFRLATLLPDLSEEQRLETMRIYSLAGELNDDRILTRPPFRSPHHSSSTEGVVGGGPGLKPGEISLAHNGILFLDEAAEFSSSILQSLREPLEERKILLSRAGIRSRFPADFLLVLAANLCPCGNRGRPSQACLCSVKEIQRYRNRIGGAVSDRVSVHWEWKAARQPHENDEIFSLSTDSESVRQRIAEIRDRTVAVRGGLNGTLSSETVRRFFRVDAATENCFKDYCRRNGLSMRSVLNLMRLALTAADWRGSESVEKRDLETVFRLRKD